ncbi:MULTISPECIES: O-antigen ligase family protein [unclassified Saccharothrix]|uniref:O-antigen ligase family protein n=1 Tax=unclassified Saccharothrix TaxID=2593673 RepID=UPI00307E75B0
MGGVRARVAVRDEVALPPHVLLLLGAIAAAVVAQGGYYLPGRVLSGALAGLALVLALRTTPLRGPLVSACGALALWALVRGGMAGDIGSALPTVAAVGCFLAGAVVVRQELCGDVLVWIGVGVAVTGWVAVVWRIPSWSVVADGLARASSTLTYPNAAAALLAAVAVYAVVTGKHASVVCLLLVGLGATLSRAGVLALVVGLLVACVAAGPRVVVKNVAAPLVGALVALAALAPSFQVARPAQVLLAVAGLVVGVFGAHLLERAGGKVRVAVLAVGLLAAGVLGATRLESLLTGRLSLTSPDRAGALGAAWDLVAAHPVIGVGPGRGLFVWTRADGDARVMRYVHNEYVQVLVELGVIGLGLVACVLVAVVLTVRRRATGPWAGAVAAVAVLVVHSGFDFLWHLPVVLLTAGLFVGLAAPPHPPEKEIV